MLTESMKRPNPIFFNDATEFRARDNYQPTLTCTPEELSFLVGKYDLPKSKWIPCGLNGCTKRHGRGFVYAKKSGEEGHCGIDCGRSHFGFAFDKVLTEYRAAEKRHSETKRLLELQEDIHEVTSKSEKIARNAEIGASRVSRLITGYLAPVPELIRQFNNAIKNGGRIQAADFRAMRLRKAAGTKQGKLDLVTMGYIRGYQAAAQYQSIVSRLRRKLVTLRRIGEADVGSLNRKERVELINDLQAVHMALQEAGVFADNARKLTSKNGIAEIAMLRKTFPENYGGKVRAALDGLDRLALTGLNDDA